VDFLPKVHFGDLLEDRASQFTFSALGQEAPVFLKKQWDEDMSKRKELKKHLDKYHDGQRGCSDRQLGKEQIHRSYHRNSSTRKKISIWMTCPTRNDKEILTQPEESTPLV
jgi:hypothetical protein